MNPKQNDPGWHGFDEDGRQQCLTCWKWQFPVIHSCPGIPQAGRERPRHLQRAREDQP